MEINEIKSLTAEIKLDRGKPSWYRRRQIKKPEKAADLLKSKRLPMTSATQVQGGCV